MPIFTNQANLTWNGGSTNSNVVTGEVLEVLSAAKTAILDAYTARDSVTYVISIRNTGTAPITALTVTDDLGGYTLNGTTLYPLTYVANSATLYVDGVVQAAPAVTAGPPLVFSGLNVPAGSSAMVIYEAQVNQYAPLDAGSTITNTATITGGGLAAPITVTAAINAQTQAELTISKAICPAVVTENSQVTYTFVIQNSGNTAAETTDNVVITDTFNPILDPITVTFNGTVWTEGVNYTYDRSTGRFTTLPGITVPAASYAQNADGTYTIDPGTATLVVTGTV